jgi:hypothetical protein
MAKKAAAASTNLIIFNAKNMMDDNEWDAEEYLEYVSEMDAADFRKYYGSSDLEEARRILLS